jgi:DNA mismatch repair protein MutS
VFLHKVKPGAADRSYGIQVAKLAGLPAQVLGRAREVLTLLEKTEGKKDSGNDMLDELPLFAVIRPQASPGLAAAPSPVEQAVDELKPDEMTPRAALDAVYHLKALRQNRVKPQR